MCGPVCLLQLFILAGKIDRKKSDLIRKAWLLKHKLSRIERIPAMLVRPERHHPEVFQFHSQPNEGHKGYEGHQSLLIVSFQFDSLQCPRYAVESMAGWLWALLPTNYYLRPNPKANRGNRRD